jgi:uncharacterized membrane protein
MATSDQLEQQLQRWTDAGILNSESAGRIREFESAHESPGVRWPVIFAIAFGSIMVAAGVLLLWPLTGTTSLRRSAFCWC